MNMKMVIQMSETKITIVRNLFEENQEIVFSMTTDKWKDLPEAKKEFMATKFNANLDDWLFVECDDESHGQRLRYIGDEE